VIVLKAPATVNPGCQGGGAGLWIIGAQSA
jgi:hypothetical protein